MALTAAQKKETDRLSAARKAELDLTKIEYLSVIEMKARVNIIGVSDTVNFAPENNYSTEDTALIQAVRPRSNWVGAVPKILEDAEVLRSEGMSEAAIAVTLGT